MQQNLFEHFNSEGHNGLLHDVSVTLINKTDAKNPHKQEHYWQHTLKTLAPHGLNVEDNLYITIFLVFIHWYHVLIYY